MYGTAQSWGAQEKQRDGVCFGRRQQLHPTFQIEKSGNIYSFAQFGGVNTVTIISKRASTH